MSIFAYEYSNYLTYLYDYKKKISFFDDLFLKANTSFKNQQSIERSMSILKDNVLLYPYFFNLITSLSNVNQVAINDCTLNDTDQLLNILCGTDVVASKSTFDKLPKNIMDLETQLFIQYSYMTDPINYYNLELYTTSYLYETKSNRNEFSNLFIEYQYDADKKDLTKIQNTGNLQKTSFVCEYAFYCFMNNFFTIYMNMQNSLAYQKKIQVDDGTMQIDFNKSFNTFVVDNQYKLAEEFINLSASVIFDFNKPLNTNVMSDIEPIVINR